MVAVVTNTGKPLMPTSPYRARKLLKKGKAKIFRYRPFTIMIVDRSDGEVQDIEYKSDTGYLHVGYWKHDRSNRLSNLATCCELCHTSENPCIYIWGILNECASETEYGRSCYEKQFAQIRSLDQNCPVTFASCKNFADLCFDLVDVVSMNVYPAWYHNTPPKKWVDDLKDWIATTGGAGKPFLLSEFGAGAIYGYYDYGRCKWSEERQADILDAQLTDFLASGYVNGTYIWQFADCNVSEEIMRQRPKCENNKGVMDLYRRPKMAFDVVRKHYKKK